MLNSVWSTDDFRVKQGHMRVLPGRGLDVQIYESGRCMQAGRRRIGVTRFYRREMGVKQRVRLAERPPAG